MTRPAVALVTGGAGFIGQHLVRALLAQGTAVTVLDDLSMGKRENVPPEARLIVGDVRDADAVAEALTDVDSVFHLAAVVSIRASVDHFVRDAAVNILGTLTLLEGMARHSIEHAVLASSMAVYAGGDDSRSLAEDSEAAPSSPYGIAKLAAERYWLQLCRQQGVAGTVLRYFNTYGPGQAYTPYVGVITIFARRLLAGQPLIVFGDGEQRRDFVHVDDVVRATLSCAQATTTENIYNVGTGRGTSVNEVARLVAERLGIHAVIEHQPARNEEVRNAVADISRIRSELGFEPSRPGLDLSDVIPATSE